MLKLESIKLSPGHGPEALAAVLSAFYRSGGPAPLVKLTHYIHFFC